ncbi:glucose-6-phosphate isomerase [Nitratifractor sp.]
MIDYRMPWNAAAEGATHALMEEAFDRLVEERERGVAGYYDLPAATAAVAEQMEAERAAVPEYRESETVVVIGIGGSSLGAKAIDRALRPISEGVRRLLFLENPDPVELWEYFSTIDPAKTLFLVISKSGGTIETVTIFKLVIQHFGLDLEGKDRRRVIVITDEGSILHRLAQKHRLSTHLIPSNVGGRFSVLSAVGVVPLTLAGYDTRSLLAGAKRMVDGFFDRREDHLLGKGAFIAEHWEEYRMNVLFAYGSHLADFTQWYIQLWGESLGKIDTSGKRVGVTPLAHIGPLDQHSFLQLIMQGPRDKTVTFLKIEKFEKDLTIPDVTLEYLEKCDYVNGHTLSELLNAECEATLQSLQQQKVPVDAIVMDRLSPENLGELVVYYELLTSVVGAMLHINTYDQPGVEVGKRILSEMFRCEEGERRMIGEGGG